MDITLFMLLLGCLPTAIHSYNPCSKSGGCNHGWCPGDGQMCSCYHGWGDEYSGCNTEYRCITRPITCHNGQVCVEPDGKCSCPAGFTGTNCETHCDSRHYGYNCEHDCNCVDANTAECSIASSGLWSNGVYGRCTCKQGWTGGYCSSDIDECQSSQTCPGNHEFCHNLNGSYACLCDAGYSRPDANAVCEDIDECQTTNKCTTNELCSNLEGSYTCFCDVGYSRPDPTSSCKGCDATHFGPDCSNTCSCAEASTADCDDKDGYCTCKYGWTGRNCDVDVDECLYINFCTGVSNEFCSNLPGNYTCLCYIGFYRPTISSICQSCNATTYGQDCASACSCTVANTADCNDKSGVCVCKHGWTGINCATDVDECRTINTCTGNNELCYNLPGSYKCLCDVGFYRADPTSTCKEPSFGTTLSVASTTTTRRPIPFACESGPNAVEDYIYTYDPAQYIHCTSDGKAYIETCPFGKLWNQAVRKCSEPSHSVG